MRPRLLGIGDNTVDIYLNEGVQYPGGNAVNVAVQARRAGAESSYLGCLGTDALGDLVHSGLVAEGVDVSHCRRIDGANAWARIRHEGHDRIFAGSTPGVRGRYGLTEADDRFIAAHDAVHTSVHSELDGQIARLRQHARLLSYDASTHAARPGVGAALRQVDIVFLSSPDISDAACHDLLDAHAATGSGLVVVTRGAAGSLARRDGVVWTQAVQPGKVVDTLGAGDAFIAAFLVTLLDGRDPGAALAAGAAHAALACATKGGFGHGAPTGPGQPGWPGQLGWPGDV